MIQPSRHAAVAVVGAGPIGLEVAYELKAAGIEYLHFEKGQIGSTISWFPQGMTFFSSNDRIAIAGFPIQTRNQEKCTKEEYLAYLRSVALARDLAVRTYEEVTAIDRDAGGAFVLRTGTASGSHQYRADRVVLATGDMAGPRRLEIVGEDLPHVSHYFESPHAYFRRRMLIVGGRNSAVEAALRCWHAGARVAMSYRRDSFDEKRVKYWLLPELVGRIDRGEIECHFETVPVRITPDRVELEGVGGGAMSVPADHVLLLTGYVPDPSLLLAVGVELRGRSGTPLHDRTTMETNVPGLYVAGTVTGGDQQTFTVFIETCHVHAQRIAAAVTGSPPPDAPAPKSLPES